MTLQSERDRVKQLVELLRLRHPELSEVELNLIATQPDYQSALAVAISFAPDFRPERGYPGAPRPQVVGRASRTLVEPGLVFDPQTGQPVFDPQTGQPVVQDTLSGQIIEGDLAGEFIASLPPPEGEAPDVEPFIGGFPTGEPGGLPLFRPLIDREATALAGGPFRGRSRQVTMLGTPPRYYEWDAWRMFAGRSPEYIAQVKQAMIAAGLVDEDGAGPLGHWRVADSQTMYAVMAEANASGKTWDTVLQEYAASYDPQSRAEAWRAANPFVAPVFRAPDYASLRQAVRQAIDAQLGRSPKDYELALLADEMRADFNRAHASEVAAARASYEAQARAVETEEPQAAGTVQDVDPLARMRERLLERYQAEIERMEETTETGINVQALLQSFAGLERAVQG